MRPELQSTQIPICEYCPSSHRTQASPVGFGLVPTGHTLHLAPSPISVGPQVVQNLLPGGRDTSGRNDLEQEIISFVISGLLIFVLINLVLLIIMTSSCYDAI